jgi:serine phosphatase RsbU (regulator of sigma subunit)
MPEPASEASPRWLSSNTLDELARLAQRSPQEFVAQFGRLDVRRRLQLRRHLYDRFRTGQPLVAVPEVPARRAASTGEAVADAREGPTLADVLDAAATAEGAPAATESGTGGGDAEFASLEAALGAADVSTAEAAPAEDAGEVEFASLDALLAGGDQQTAAAPSTEEEETFSLEDLLGGETDSSGDTAAEAEPTAVEVEEPPEPEGLIPADYGVPIPVMLPLAAMRDFLRNLRIFNGVTDDGLEKMASLMSVVKYGPRQLLCREGDAGDAMYIIKEGAIRVLPQGRDLGIVLPSGQPIGEMSILDGNPRSATLVTDAETILLRYTLESYAQTFRVAPEAGLAFLRNLAEEQQNRVRSTTVKAAAEQAEKEKAEAEIQRAKETQDLALPKGYPKFGTSRFWHSYTGARDVSGDFYDFITFDDNPDQLIVIFGDSTGHGLHAGLVMLMAKSASFTQLHNDPSVESITKAINQIICYIYGTTMMMTFIIALIDRAKHTIRFTNAGQQYAPYLYRPSTDQFVELEAQTFQLGINPMAEYDHEEVSWEPGDLLIFYSDGFIEAPYCPPEATEPDRDDMYGTERFQELIRRTHHLSEKEITEALRKEVKAFCRYYDGHEVFGAGTPDETEEDGDDITSIIIRLDASD